MKDEFDQELDKGPQGSILTPIFLGCGAMGLGCVFSLGAIVIALMVFAPGLWNVLSNISNEEPLVGETVELVMAHPDVFAAVGEPYETYFQDANVPDVQAGDFSLGDELTFITEYDIIGPFGTAEVEAEGSQAIMEDGAWTLISVTAVLEDGTVVRIIPPTTDTPPVPAQLAPPTNDATPTEGNATEGSDQGSSGEPNMDDITMGDGPLDEMLEEAQDVAQEADGEPEPETSDN